MSKRQTYYQTMFTPQQHKTFAGALDAFFAEECPQVGGLRTRQVLVQHVSEMVRQFYPETSHLQPGQTPWVTVHKDAKSAYGKRIKDTQLTNVVLDLVQPQDAVDRANGRSLRELKIDAVARLFNQAHEQDGCMTNAEVAILLKLSPSTVGNYARIWEAQHQQVVPKRGSIHDIGPTLTHKKIIIHKLFIQQKTVQQTARETFHSLPAIQRYISTFKQVLLCRQKEMNTQEIAFTLQKGIRLIKEYESIIEEYADKNYVLERLLGFQPHIENNIEKWANENGRKEL